MDPPTGLSGEIEAFEGAICSTFRFPIPDDLGREVTAELSRGALTDVLASLSVEVVVVVAVPPINAFKCFPHFSAMTGNDGEVVFVASILRPGTRILMAELLGWMDGFLCPCTNPTGAFRGWLALPASW